MPKPQIIEVGFEKFPATITELKRQHKPEFVLETETKMYRANTLDGVLVLWRKANDKSRVINVTRIG